MSNSKKVTDAIEKVFEELMAMPVEELRRKLDEAQLEMDEAILNGEPHLGFSIWYGQDPIGADAYREELFKKAGKK